jgi:hypothetical protein
MARHTPKRRRDSALVSLTGLVLSVLLSAPVALAQEGALILEINITGATLDRSRFVTVTGTVTCTEPAVISYTCVDVTQPVGRTDSVSGSACPTLNVQCEPTAPATFSIAVSPSNGRFVPGETFVHAFTFGCSVSDGTDCNSDEITVSRRLRY